MKLLESTSFLVILVVVVLARVVITCHNLAIFLQCLLQMCDAVVTVYLTVKSVLHLNPIMSLLVEARATRLVFIVLETKRVPMHHGYLMVQVPFRALSEVGRKLIIRVLFHV